MSLIRTLEGHTYTVTSLAVLQNGHLASASRDHTIKIWDPSSGTLLKTLEGHTDWVVCLLLLPNGHLASGSLDESIKIWDTANGNLVRTIKTCSSIWSFLLLPNGLLASGGSDLTIKIWDTTNENLVRTIKTCDCSHACCSHIFHIWSFLLLPNGHLASCGGNIKIWDPSNGVLLKKLEKPWTGHALYSLVSLGNQFLVTASTDDIIQIWDHWEGKLIRTIKHSLNMDASNGLLAVAHHKNIEIMNTNFEVIQTIQANGESLFLYFLPNGQLAGADNDNNYIWDPLTGELLFTIHDNRMNQWLSLPNGTLASCSDDETINIWDMQVNKPLVTEKFGDLIKKTTCPICYEKIYNTHRKIVLTQCGHLVCKTCFDSYMTHVKNTNDLANCPYCTKELLTAIVVYP